MHWWDVRRGVPDAASAHKMSDDEPSAAVAADETRRSGKSAREAAKKRKKEEKLKRKSDKGDAPAPSGSYVDQSPAPQDQPPANS